MKYQVWMEGFRVMEGSATAEFLGEYEADTFKEACKKAVRDKGYEKAYDADYNTVWGCFLYDNETDARRFFG